MMHFGIIGYPLKHSFSAEYFTHLFHQHDVDAEYRLYPLEDIGLFPELVRHNTFRGLNVTMPFKQTVIRYLDSLDETAQAIGAVNVIRFDDNGHMRGYNTDAIGFMNDIRPQLLPSDTNALVLGPGGASKAVSYALQQLGIRTKTVSRNPERGIGYGQLTQELLESHTIIVNATPLGMHPLEKEKPDFPYELLTEAHFLYDVIYNPVKTVFLQEGEQRGCRICNGLGMLYGQALAAWDIWKQ